MHQNIQWTPEQIRRAAIPATSTAGLRDVIVLGDANSGSLFQDLPANDARFNDAQVTQAMTLRALHLRDPRFFSAAREARLFSDADMARVFSPTPDSMHSPTFMPNVLEQYTNNAMVASAVMPVVAVQQRSDIVGSIPMGTGLSPVDTSLAGQQSMLPELRWNVASRGTYRVKDRGLRVFVPKQSTQFADAPFEVRRRSAMILADTLELMQEITVAATLSTSGNYQSGYSSTISTSTDKWDNPASDPIDQIRQGKRKLLRGNGTKVKLVMGVDVFIALQKHPKILASIYGRASTSAGATPLSVTKELLAALFQVDEVVVGEAKYNSANDGATIVLADVWSGFAALVVVVDAPSALNTAGFGYQLRLGQVAMKTQFIPDLLPGIDGGEHCKVTHSTDEFITSAYGAYGFLTVLS